MKVNSISRNFYARPVEFRPDLILLESLLNVQPDYSVSLSVYRQLKHMARFEKAFETFWQGRVG